MNILITGGCGFIGSHFALHFLTTHPQWNVINLDALTYAAHPDTPAHLEGSLSAHYRFIQEDITSPRIAEILRTFKINSIVNFAAETHVDRSILDPDAFVRTNILGVQNLLQSARALGQVRFLQVSTDEVYGSLEPQETAFTEASPLTTNSPYAASKAGADLLVLASHRTYGLDAILTRCSNNFGPFQFPEKLIPLVIANALEGLPVPVYGDGRQIRDWIFVKDHCEAIDAVLLNGRSGEVYNISAGEERPNIDVVKMILDTLGQSHSLITMVRDRPAHDRRYALSSAKIRRELHWQPNTEFENGLRLTVQWYLENQAWWKKVRGKDYFKYYEANYQPKFQVGETGRSSREVKS